MTQHMHYHHKKALPTKLIFQKTINTMFLNYFSIIFPKIFIFILELALNLGNFIVYFLSLLRLIYSLACWSNIHY